MGLRSKLRTWLPFGEVAEVAARELGERLRGDAPPQILDVRSAWEFARGHIDGAVNVPLTRLASALGALPFDPQRPVVVICLTAHRSIPAVRLLEARGYAAAAQLAGGMRAWWAAGLPTLGA